MLNARLIRNFSTGPIILFLGVSIGAQTPAAVQPQSSSPPKSVPTSKDPRTKASLERQFFINLLRDQRAIWTSPFHLGAHDAYWLVPVGLGAAALIGTDQETAEQLGNNATRLSITRNTSRVGAGYTAAGIAGGFYLVGRLTGNEKAREAGILSAEVLIDGAVVGQALKLITERPRPKSDNGSGEFFAGGSSFPSGHSITAWALATVVANEYHDRRLVQIGAYSLAAMVSMSRFSGRNHFLTDVLVGSAMGFGMGRYVYRAHHDTSLDPSSSKLARISFSPRFQPRGGGRPAMYGLSVAYHL